MTDYSVAFTLDNVGREVFQHGEGLPLLEFVPLDPGKYSVTFKIPVEETINDGAFQYESRVTQFALFVKEDVLPMKATAYPHKKVDLRQTVGGRTKKKEV